MKEEEKFSYEHPKIDPKIVELFLGLEQKVGQEKKPKIYEILGELKIGHRPEALELLGYLRRQIETQIESKKNLVDELKMVEGEIGTMQRILNNPEYKKEWDVYKEMLEKYEKEHESLQEKIKQAEAAAADLASIEEIEQKLKETE